LIDQLRSLLLSEGADGAAVGLSGQIVLYTSFGVVRGRVAPAFVRQLAERDRESSAQSPPMVEIYDASVEHYSSHLPTGSFASFFVRLGDVNGIAIERMPNQS
jgi:hypothetical protein